MTTEAEMLNPDDLAAALDEAMRRYRESWRDHEYVHPDEGAPPMLRRLGAPCARCGLSHGC